MIRKKRNASTAKALLMLVGSVAMIGCGTGEGNNVLRSGNAAVLLGDGIAFAPGEKQVTIVAPPDTGIKQQIKLQSPSLSLTAMTVITTCGCASANLSKDYLMPGDELKLQVCFDPSVVTGSKQVKALLQCKEMPLTGIQIPIGYSSDETLSAWRLKASPAEFSVDGIWSNGRSNEFVSTLECGSLIDQSRLKISVSNEAIRACYVREDSKRPSVRIEIDSLPVGPINESIVIEYPLEYKTYYAKISIRGAIRPPFECKPASLIAKRGENGAYPTVFVDVLRNDGGTGSPEVDVSGDWSIDQINQESPIHWKVRLSPKTATTDETTYGILIVKGDWRGRPVTVPLTASL